MNFLIISSVGHKIQGNQFFGYAPYIREINIWAKHVSKVTVVAPFLNTNPTEIETYYDHENVDFKGVKSFSVLGIFEVLKTFYKIPQIIFITYFAMCKADHIHLRCPGNMGLLACFVQILFPKKPKSAKYAGNWNLKAKKPFTYKLQQWILNNTFFTRNMQVLVYGKWENASRNIIPFFTATYSRNEVIEINKTDINEAVKFIFTGMLVKGKNPLYAIKLIEGLHKNGINSSIEIYGNGIELSCLENYILENKLQDFVFLKGNHNKETLKLAYQKSHFVLLPSISEGWPKVVAEGMFWGCVPLALPVSCVPQMLDFGNRGLLLSYVLEIDIKSIIELILDSNKYKRLSENSKKWSQEFTTEKFEMAIKNILSL